MGETVIYENSKWNIEEACYMLVICWKFGQVGLGFREFVGSMPEDFYVLGN